MLEIIKLMEAVSRILWPVTIMVIIISLIALFKHLIKNANHRAIKIKIGGNEIEIGEFVKQQSALFGELHKQVSATCETGEKEDLVNALPEKNRILWVDDQPINNIVLNETLKSQGFIIDHALSTSEAIQLFNTKKYDIVISDMVRMENNRHNRVAGLELARAVRATNVKVPLIVYTSSVNVTKNREEAGKLRIRIISSSVEVLKFVYGSSS